MKIEKILLIFGILLFVASMATCYFGVQYATSQIPPDRLSQMDDTDWIGIEWIGKGAFLLVLSFFCILTSVIVGMIRHTRNVK
jgi:TRAP-type C4-dicarboxylate transport system permease small subunit